MAAWEWAVQVYQRIMNPNNQNSQEYSTSNNSSMWPSQFLWDYSNDEYLNKEMSKYDRKMENAQNQANTYLTGNEVQDSIITTPQSQWTAQQQAIASMNPDLKKLNSWYLRNIEKLQNLENEKVNLAEAKQIMQKAYQDAINATEKSANGMMAANMANANIQAGWAISSARWLSTNPAAAAATRMSAQNQAAIQNASVRSQANQNIANIYSNMAQMPSVLSSIAANNNNADINRINAEWNALANYKSLTTENTSNNWGWYSYSSWWWSSKWWSSKWWNDKEDNNEEDDNKVNIFTDEYLKSLSDDEKVAYYKLLQALWAGFWYERFANKIANGEAFTDEEYKTIMDKAAEYYKNWMLVYNNWTRSLKNKNETKDTETKDTETNTKDTVNNTKDTVNNTQNKMTEQDLTNTALRWIWKGILKWAKNYFFS